MANFPTSLHTKLTLVDNVDDVLASHPNTLSDELYATQVKVGVDNSADITSIDYFLKHASGAYRTHVHDGTSDDGSASIGPLTGLTIANNVDVGNYQIRALQFYADATTGTAPLVVDSTTIVTNLNADKVDGYDVGNSNGNIPISNGTINTNLNADLLDGQEGNYYNDIANLSISSQAQGDILYFDGAQWNRLPAGTSGYVLKTQGAGANPIWDSADVADGSITQAKLSTTTGAVSTTTQWESSGGVGELLTLPGGSYGFYPQCRVNDGTSSWVASLGLATNGSSFSPANNNTTYGTYIILGLTNTISGHIAYAQQRYVTASGKDHWIFLLVAKRDIVDEQGNLMHKKGSIIASYEAPDHPCANQEGATELDIPHPFGSYDSDKHEIVLVDNAILGDLFPLVDYRNDLLSLINEKCIIDDYKRPKYRPREIVKINEYPDKIKIGEVIDRFSIKKAIKIGLAPSGIEMFFTRDEITKERRMVENLLDYIKYKSLWVKK